MDGDEDRASGVELEDIESLDGRGWTILVAEMGRRCPLPGFFAGLSATSSVIVVGMRCFAEYGTLDGGRRASGSSGSSGPGSFGVGSALDLAILELSCLAN